MSLTIAAANGQVMAARVNDPRMGPIDADILMIPDQATAVIEMALASGLALLAKFLQDPGQTTTLGTGELVKAAMDKGCPTWPGSSEKILAKRLNPLRGQGLPGALAAA